MFCKSAHWSFGKYRVPELHSFSKCWHIHYTLSKIPLIRITASLIKVSRDGKAVRFMLVDTSFPKFLLESLSFLDGTCLLFHFWGNGCQLSRSAQVSCVCEMFFQVTVVSVREISAGFSSEELSLSPQVQRWASVCCRGLYVCSPSCHSAFSKGSRTFGCETGILFLTFLFLSLFLKHEREAVKNTNTTRTVWRTPPGCTHTCPVETAAFAQLVWTPTRLKGQVF